MGSVVPILGIITQTKFRVRGDQYRNVLANMGSVNTVVVQVPDISRRPPAGGSHLIHTGTINTTPVQNTNTGGGANNPPPPPPVTSPGGNNPGGSWSGGGYWGSGEGIPDPPPTNGIPENLPQQYQPLGNDTNGCPYYGIDQNGNFLYGKDKHGNIITDPKTLPCYMEKHPAATGTGSTQEVIPGPAPKKSYKTFNTIGLLIVAGAVGVAIYKYKTKTKTN